MTCKYVGYSKGISICKKGYKVQFTRCTGRGKPMPCYKERMKEGEKNGVKQ